MGNNEPIRIIVETVPHEVVSELKSTDESLRCQLNALRSMFSQSMDVLSELKKEIANLKNK